MINGFFTSKQTADPSAGSSGGMADGWMAAQKFTTPASAITVEELHVFTSDSGDVFRLGIYADSGGSMNGSVLAGSDGGELTAAATAAWTGNTGLSVSLDASTDYWLAWIMGGGARLNYDTTGGTSKVGGGVVTYPTWPTSPAPQSRTWDFAIQAVYSVAGGGGRRRILLGDMKKIMLLAPVAAVLANNPQRRRDFLAGKWFGMR